MLIASAPTKTILFGEHAVVYGYPAIAGALDIYVYTKLREISEPTIVIRSREYHLEWRYGEPVPIELRPIVEGIIRSIERDFDISLHKAGIYAEIFSDAPPACGLGTSAGISVAFTTALLRHLDVHFDKNLINKYAYEAEKISHGKPSGIDNTISVYGGILKYMKGPPPKIEQLNQETNFSLILVDTMIPKNTKKAVMMVSSLRDKHYVINDIMKTIGEITEEAWRELKKGTDADIERIGELMNINHGLLSSLGVSSSKIEEIVYFLRNNGALGSKLTGAGIGGFVLGVVSNEKLKQIKRSLTQSGYRFFVSRINMSGVKLLHEKKI